jgi:hypothetical protein
MKLMVFFRNSANAPKHQSVYIIQDKFALCSEKKYEANSVGRMYKFSHVNKIAKINY